jgi:sec-independent protein translocase protein TatB
VFNLTGSEIVVILLLALVILGPDKLPDAMRKAGRTWAELKKLSNGFQDEVRKGFEEPSAEVKKTANAVKKAASFANAPVKSAQKSAKGAMKSLLDPPKPAAVETTASEPVAAVETTASEPVGADVEADAPAGAAAADVTDAVAETAEGDNAEAAADGAVPETTDKADSTS